MYVLIVVSDTKRRNCYIFMKQLRLFVSDATLWPKSTSVVKISDKIKLKSPIKDGNFVGVDHYGNNKTYT